MVTQTKTIIDNLYAKKRGRNNGSHGIESSANLQTHFTFSEYNA